MGSETTFTDLVEDFGQRWNRFWFTPADALPACVLRICVGLLAAAHFLDVGYRLNVWYASDSAVPPTAVRRLLELTASGEEYRYTYLDAFPASTGLFIVHGLALVLALAFAAGFLTRITGLLTLAALLAYVHRFPQVAGHIEPVLCFLTGYLCIAPSGSRLSIDRRLFGGAKK